MFRPLLCLVAALAVAGPVTAQTKPAGAPPAASASDAAQTTLGEVRKVDKATGKLTIKHEEIKPLGMPAMTMVFVAGDKSMLERFKPGDRIRFRATHQGDTFTVVEIRSAR
jgi:Cu/Ag efflux protein CusF